MRPRSLDEVVGQDHLLAAGSPLRRLVEGDAPMSLILFGPPGTGKTTLALIVSSATNRRFAQLSALNAGVKDVREVIAQAKADYAKRTDGNPYVCPLPTNIKPPIKPRAA
ncbi:MAG: AAA family ATPase [Rhodospirillales bacterium]|nr:AAA family ATPase [Rhodospirillales bacterium]